MATRTPNLGLSKAELTDAIRSTLTANNNNFDTLDSVCHDMQWQINRLRANQISGKDEGEEIVVEDSAEVESVLKVSGNSEQDSRSGKNKLKMTISSQTRNGINLVVHEDGTLDVNGTATASTTFELNGNLLDVIKQNTKYYLYTSVPYNLSSFNISIAMIPASSSQMTWMIGGRVSTSPSEKLNIAKADLHFDSGVTVNQNNVKIMLVESDVIDNEWEPYGAMPSPEFPSEIRSVKSKSDNLFDSDYSLVTKGGFTKLEDGSYYRSSVEVKNGVWVNEEEYTGQIAIRGELKWVNYSTYSGEIVEFEYTDGTKVSVMGNVNEYRDKWGIFEGVSDNTKVLKQINLTYGGESENYFRNIMSNKGTVALPYQPYGYVPVEVKVEAKNLFNPLHVGYGISSTGELATNASLTTSDFISIKPNVNYYFSNICGRKLGRGVNAYDINKTYITSYLLDDVEEYSGTLTFDNNVAYIRVVKPKNSQAQVEEGSSATPYVPYVEPKVVSLPLGDIELRSTPDGTRDTFVRVDGVWNKEEAIGSIEFDGSETINYYDAPSSTIANSLSTAYFSIPNINISYHSFISNVFAENYYSAYSIWGNASSTDSSNPQGMFIDCNTKSIRIRINKSLLIGWNDDLTATEKANLFKNWLSENNILLCYIKTPTYIPITDNALIQALDELESLILHKGYNRITATSINGVKAQLELSYYKDINSVIDNINATLLTLGGGASV